jgi:carboxyl-terminal processing protease
MENSNPPAQRNKVSTIIFMTAVISITLGVFIGASLFSVQSPVSIPVGKAAKNADKFKSILQYIDRYYVDNVDIDTLSDIAIEEMLKKLDPHTVYIPAKESEIVSTQLEDGFEGVGLEFNVFQDTVRIVGLVEDAPAIKAGLKVGDRIVEVNGESVVGAARMGGDMLSKLRGKKGTSASVKIVRKNHTEPLIFNIVRDKIPTYTIETSFMIDSTTGFIKIERFGETTYEEFKYQLIKLKGQGMNKLILDVRDNGGGFLKQAVDIADELLQTGKTIVYTDGRVDKFDSKDFSKADGSFEEGSVIVLINEYSASASEILAGALQDNDRAILVGRRSFGKGLVQRQIQLGDKSLLRLTISKYYTPSGRSIQKPFSDYDLELAHRYEHGEYFHQDSIHFVDSLRKFTSNGRVVYGGGGIMPDYFVAFDTSYHNKFYIELAKKDIIRDFAIDYATNHEKELIEMGLDKFVNEFDIKKSVESIFFKYLQQRDIKFNTIDYQLPAEQIRNEMKADIARTIWKSEGFFKVINQKDAVFRKALEVINEADKIQ